jgi:hypothetical protein
VNILDENISGDERRLLLSQGIAVHHIGFDLGRPGMQDSDIIPLLHTLRRPTFFTFDLDFYKRNLCHAGYSLAYLTVGPNEAARFIRRILRHPQFNTQAKRMGAVIRASDSGLTVRRLHAMQATEYAWIN